MDVGTEITIARKSDGTDVRMQVGIVTVTMTTAQVSELIETLAGHREKMLPPVPIQPDTGTSIVSSPVSATSVSTHPAEHMVGLWLRHEGYGWIVLSLQSGEAQKLGDQLLEAAAQMRRTAN